MENNRQTALVTGGNRGIGKAIALQLAKDGFNIIVNYLNESALESALETKTEIEAFGVECLLVPGDVSKFEDCEAMTKLGYEKFTNIEVLVNNAGITKDMLLMKMKPEDFMQVIDVNLLGTFNMIKACNMKMMRARYGRIINISSVIGVVGNAGQINYSASKAGVIGVTKSVAKELATRGITCNAIAPGYIETDMTKVLPDAVKEEISSKIATKKLGQPSDIANAVSFLAKPETGYITGQVLNVCGGMVM